MRVHYLQHVSFEDAADIAVWAQQRGHIVTVTRLYEDEPLPDIASVGLLAVMGGPMNVYQYRDHPWLRREKAYIRHAIDADIAVIGVCLGAQLIADVLGARVVQNPQIEIGWHTVHLTPEACEALTFRHMPTEFTAFHWHGDTFDIPPGAARLAASEACPNQAFEYGGRVLGLQFHLEYSADSINRMLVHCAGELTDAPFIQSREQIVTGYGQIPATRQLMFSILDAMERRSVSA